MHSDGGIDRIVSLLAVQQLNGTVNTGSVQAQNFRNCDFYVAANAGGGLTFTAKLQHSTDNSTWVDAPSPNTVTITNTQDKKWIHVDHQNLNAYLRLVLATTGNMSLSAFAVQSGLKTKWGTAPALTV